MFPLLYYCDASLEEVAEMDPHTYTCLISLLVSVCCLFEHGPPQVLAS
jgi:hypothetical protein